MRNAALVCLQLLVCSVMTEIPPVGEEPTLRMHPEDISVALIVECTSSELKILVYGLMRGVVYNCDIAVADDDPDSRFARAATQTRLTPLSDDTV